MRDCECPPARLSRLVSRRGIQKVDVFAVGVLLYLMLSGRLPFLPTRAHGAPAANAAADFPALQRRMELGRRLPPTPQCGG